MSRARTLTLSLDLREGLSPKEAARRVRAGLRCGDMGNHVAAFYLADLVDRKGYLELGYTSARDYAARGLRMPESSMWKLITVGRALRDLPVIVAFFAEDRLTWTQVRALITIATPETERAWAEWAEKHNTKQLDALIGRREKGDLPTGPDRRRIHHPQVGVGAKLGHTHYRTWQLARAKLEALCGGPISDRDMMMHVAQMILRQQPDGTVPGWTKVNDTHYLLHLYPRAQGSEELVTVGEEGGEIPIDRADLTGLPSPSSGVVDASASADVVDAAALDPENHGPLVPEAQRDVPTGDELRKEILVRDGYSCRCCGSKKNVTVHHRVWLTYGGKTVRENLFAACEDCHSSIHDRRLIVLGDPTGELRFLNCEGGTRERTPMHPVELEVIPAPSAPARGLEVEGSVELDRPPVELDRPPVELDRPPVELDRPPVELDRLPVEVDADWWKRHEHLLSWHERSSELVLTPGCAREVSNEPTITSTPAAGSAPRLTALVGQTAVRDRLDVAITAARLRGEQLGHLLFAGAPGLGKTSLAQAVAGEFGAPLSVLAAPHVRTPDALVRTLVGLPRGGVLFLDEIHALPDRAAEVMYAALDEGVLSLPVRQGPSVRTLRVRLQPFTLIGATTDPDQLPRAFLSRLEVLRVEAYSAEELTAILDRAAREHGLELTPEGAERLARASRDTPRRALALLRAVRDEATVAKAVTVDLATVERALERQGVDAQGLDRLDRSYLRVLESAAQPVGLKTLAARLDVSEETLRTVHEAHLVRCGLVRVTPAGRVRTEKSAA